MRRSCGPIPYTSRSGIHPHGCRDRSEAQPRLPSTTAERRPHRDPTIVDYVNIRWVDEWCKRCNICVEICPKDSLVLTHDAIIEATDCIRCGLCERYCPDLAIEVLPKRDEAGKPARPRRRRPRRPRQRQAATPTSRTWPAARPWPAPTPHRGMTDAESDSRRRPRQPDLSEQDRPMTKRLVQGNEAVLLGAVRAGASYFAGYPISPSSRDPGAGLRLCREPSRVPLPPGRGRDRQRQRDPRRQPGRRQVLHRHLRPGLQPDAGGDRLRPQGRHSRA